MSHETKEAPDVSTRFCCATYVALCGLKNVKRILRLGTFAGNDLTHLSNLKAKQLHHVVLE